MKDRGRSVVERFLSLWYFGRTKDERVYRMLQRRTCADRMDLENLAAARWYLLTEILFCIFCTIHKFPVFWIERDKRETDPSFCLTVRSLTVLSNRTSPACGFCVGFR